jgi:hypothetical protein
MRRPFVIVAACVAALAALTVGVAMASTGPSTARASGDSIHVVFGPGSHDEFLDFNDNGPDFGDRFAARGPLWDESQSERVGTAYVDCLIASRALVGGTFDCTYVLKFKDGDITTQGTDPQGPSDVFFAVTGGTGAYREASGEARHIDTDVSDIIIDLED